MAHLVLPDTQADPSQNQKSHFLTEHQKYRIMGRAKNEMMEYEELGFSKPNETYVCSNHFDDEAIVSFIEEVGSKISCSYCKPKYQSESVISFDELMRFLCRGIYYFYDDAANAGLAYETAEGGYQGEHYDTYDLIHDEIGLEVDNDKIVEQIINSLPDYYWCKKDPYTLDENQELMYDWDYFSNLLKHKIRYTFFKTKEFDKEEYKETSDILREIAVSIDNLNLITELKNGTPLYRCRQHSMRESPRTVKELGSPPVKFCTFSNRMSPSGISMFYGAFDSKTSINEAYDDSKEVEKPLATIGKFFLKKNLQVIDLTNIPETPSLFDDEKRNLRFKTLFLKAFVADLAKNIKRDGYEHINYIPTQVVTEYFRFVLPEIAHYKIDGLIYPSSKNINGCCCVIFCDNEECEEIFELPENEIKTIEIKNR